MPPASAVAPLATLAFPLPNTLRRRTREPRMAHRAPCQIRCLIGGADVEQVATGETLNVSSRGLAVQIGCDLPEGTLVEVLMHCESGEPAFLRGRVARRRQVTTGTYEIGISITAEFRPGHA